MLRASADPVYSITLRHSLLEPIIFFLPCSRRENNIKGMVHVVTPARKLNVDMQVEAIPTQRIIRLTVLNLAVGVVLSAVGTVIIVDIFGWWAVAVLSGCTLSVFILSRARTRGRLSSGWLPYVWAAGGGGIIAFWMGIGLYEYEWISTFGILLFAIAGFDLIKRGWEAPVSARMVWSRIEWLALFFSLLAVYLGYNAAVQSSKSTAIQISNPTMVPATETAKAMPIPSERSDEVESQFPRRSGWESPVPSLDSSPYSRPGPSVVVLLPDSFDLMAGVDSSEVVLLRSVATSVYGAHRRCITELSLRGQPVNWDEPSASIAITLRSGGHTTILEGSPEADYRCRIGEIDAHGGELLIALTVASGAVWQTDSLRVSDDTTRIP